MEWSNQQRNLLEIYTGNTFPLGNISRTTNLKEIEINETSKSRIIGLTLETRPDSLLGIEGDMK